MTTDTLERPVHCNYVHYCDCTNRPVDALQEPLSKRDYRVEISPRGDKIYHTLACKRTRWSYDDIPSTTIEEQKKRLSIEAREKRYQRDNREVTFVPDSDTESWVKGHAPAERNRRINAMIRKQLQEDRARAQNTLAVGQPTQDQRATRHVRAGGFTYDD